MFNFRQISAAFALSCIFGGVLAGQETEATPKLAFVLNTKAESGKDIKGIAEAKAVSALIDGSIGEVIKVISGTGKFDVLDKKGVSAAMKKLNLKDIMTEEQAISLGKELDAANVLNLDIAAKGTSATLDARLVNVATGASVSASEPISDIKSQALPAVKKVCSKLLGIELL